MFDRVLNTPLYFYSKSILMSISIYFYFSLKAHIINY